MTKTIALTSFHGANFANVYEQGKEYYFETAIAETLAARNLVKILAGEEKAEVKETPSCQETVNAQSQTQEQPKVEEPKNEEPKQEEETPSAEELPKDETTEEATEEKPKRGRKPSVKE